GVDPMAIRLALLNHHYRRDWEWFDHDLATAEARLTAWRAAFAADSGAPSAPVFGSVRAALRNDLNAPAALSAVDAWVARSAVDDSERHSPFEVRRLVDALLGVL
ncbi:MAG: cysteine--1-D-myo-inosityl 2-amino-2-deoxy-alpha-D-glucopyranoside ligase, partial [Micropruina sp.]